MKKKNYEERKKIIYELIDSDFYVPMKEKEMAMLMQVEKEDRPDLKNALEELLAEGKIQISKRGKYSKGDPFISGKFISHSKGFGFVEVEGEAEDYYIPESNVNGAFHGDTVAIRILPAQNGKRTEAEVVSIIARGCKQVIGTYSKSSNYGFLIPDNQKIASDIFIPAERSKGAVDGHKVVVEITDYQENGKRKNPEGKVIEILGHINDPGVDIMSIIKGFELPTEFPDRVLNQATRVAKEVSEADKEGRLDLTDKMMVTIDGEDAKDLDDAVSLVKEDELYHLGVHIADVTNYVQENSALDRDALERGTSIYLVDRVIPMLPHVLSNGICSLNPDEERLALSCLMTINDKGDVVDYKIAETVIKTKCRMSYTSVKKILEDKDENEMETYNEIVPMFQQMEELSAILRQKRKQRGSIDFDFAESKILLDKLGKPLAIEAHERNVATKIIEDFMLLANETVASHFYWLELPFVYRTHDVPDNEKIKQLSLFIESFGYSIKTTREEIHPKELQKLLGKIDGSQEETLISRLVLRSMKQAKYTTDCTGHFGLASQYYCHFTSPIRRYPDLQIHRIIKEHLRGRLKTGRLEHYKSILDGVAKHSSDMERRAEEAERETDKMKKAEYMLDHIGETYEGVISGVTSWGIYVELENTIEGMVHLASISNDFYFFEERTYEIIGESTGIRYKLGQRVRIKVKSADKITKTIDFLLVQEEGESEVCHGR